MAGIDTMIKVSGSVPANTTTNDIAAIDIAEDGRIVCIGGSIQGIYNPTPAAMVNISLRVAAELSFLSSNQIGINDARGMLAGVTAAAFCLFSEATETGGGGGKLSEMGNICPGDGIIVNAGERIHLHGFSSEADLTAIATFILYISTVGGGRRAQKRR